MVTFIQTIIAILLSLTLQTGVSDAVQTSPAAAASDFLNGLTSGDQTVMEQYVDNEYVNFLVNTQGDKEMIQRMDHAVFENLDYLVVDTAAKGNIAVAKIKVTTNDFSKVLDKYDDASQEYLMDNLYNDEVIENKEKLNAQCLRIYVEQIEKTAAKDADDTTYIFLPMTNDGYGGWKMVLSNHIMKVLMGNLSLPDTSGSQVSE